MKIDIFIAIAVLGASATFAQPTHTAKITVRVVDESGKPVTNAPVVASVVDHYQDDEFGDSPVYRDLTVRSDDHGLAVITAPGAEQALNYSVINFPGFYSAGTTYTFKSAMNGDWQPWNPTVELVLEAIGVQMPVYAQKILNKAIPAQGKPVGYDLMAGDWVAPYGKGETPDFIFQLDTRTTNYLTLKFSNEGDGIQFCASSGGRVPLTRLAPSDGYESTLVKWDWTEHGISDRVPFVKAHSNYRADANYYFRVRTQMDSNGAIASALYGKIDGDFSRNLQQGKIDLNYSLNPQQNSRNMEFDPKRNLCVEGQTITLP
jgi:hypothetical protein